jgi:hypothetical protein
MRAQFAQLTQLPQTKRVQTPPHPHSLFNGFGLVLPLRSFLVKLDEKILIQIALPDYSIDS